MSTSDMREEVAVRLNDLDDSFIEAVHAMVGAYRVKSEKGDAILGCTLDGQPKLASKMKKICDDEVRLAEEKGTFITLKYLEEESAKW